MSNSKPGADKPTQKKFPYSPPSGPMNGGNQWLDGALLNIREMGAALRTLGAAYWKGGYELSFEELIGLYRELRSRKTQAESDWRRLRALIREKRHEFEALRRRLDGDE